MRLALLAAVIAIGACAKRAPEEPDPVKTTAASTAATPVSVSASVSASESASASASAKPMLPRSVRCGSKRCMPGDVCCNPLMEFCAPPGASCPH